MKYLVTGNLEKSHKDLMPHPAKLALDLLDEGDLRVVAVMLQPSGKFLMQPAFVALCTIRMVMILDDSSGKELSYDSVGVFYDDISAITTHRSRLIRGVLTSPSTMTGHRER